jgi:hypothetical protein
MQNLSQDELLLLAKLGVKMSDLQKKVKRERSSVDKEPQMIKMDDFSGRMILTCKCCGVKEIKFIDYVKRADCEGYTIVTVSTPSHEIKREHVQDVLWCRECTDSMLQCYEKEDLINMVIKLRKMLIKKGNV